jgi:hypothetical protein
MRTSIGSALLFLLGVLTATTAHADKVGVVVAGEATLQPQVNSQIERWLHDRNHTLVPGALEPDAINTLIDCFVLDDLGCARSTVNARAGSTSILYARIDQSTSRDGAREISITAFLFRKDQDAISEQRSCSACNDSKLVEIVDELLGSLVRGLPTRPIGDPPPSTNTTTSIAAVPVERTRATRLLPYGLIGVGGLALASGLVMLAIDEDPEPVGMQEPTYRDTATGGAIVGMLGAAALGVGCYLWLSERSSSTPVAAVTRDGGVIGWAGRF